MGEGENVKDAFYFSHDSNARNDPKILAMRSRYGYQGYGWYWAFIESLRDQPNYKYPLNKYTIDALALLWQCDRTAAEQYVSDCCHEFTANGSALMCIDDCFVWSESFSRRMEAVDIKRAKASESARSGWKQSGGNAKAKRTHSERNASKGKESKELISINRYKNEALNNALESFVSMRCEIKNPITERAMGMMIAKLDTIAKTDDEKIAILNESVMNCWKGVFPLKNRPPQPQEHNYRMES